jgi:hypothetical protein
VTLKERIALWSARREIVNLAERIIGRPLTHKEKGMFKNWKTSLAGIAMAAIQMHQGGMTWGNAVIAALMALMGLAAKDHDMTGGTKTQ